MAVAAKNAVCSKEDLSALVASFERCAERQAANAGSTVKLKASERDLVAAAEHLRDFCIAALKGGKDVLQEVFGGTCEEIGRSFHVLDTVQLSDMHKDDQRWEGCRQQLEGVKRVLLDLGSFKPWVVTLAKPEAVEYPDLESRYSPGERVQLTPVTRGAAPTQFVCEALPESLRINRSSGVISGQLKPGVEVDMKSYIVVASNNHGETRGELKFCIKEPPPADISYDVFPDRLLLGEPIIVEASVGSGCAVRWSVRPELPEGLALEAATGKLVGVPRRLTPVATYTVTAGNDVGEASTAVTFAVAAPAPLRVVYPEACEEYPCNSVVYLVPEVDFQNSARAARLSVVTEALAAAAFATLGVGARSSLRRGSVHRASMRRRSSVASCTARRSIAGIKALPQGLTWSVEPALPEGLELSETQGVLSGRPTKRVPLTEYCIRARNGSGEAECSLRIGIRNVPPSDLEYPDVEEDGYFVGEPLSLEPEVDGIAAEWLLEGTLPAGLTLDTSMGIIGGIPTEVGSSTVKVVAKNEDGETSAEVTFLVRISPPSELTYPTLQEAYALRRKLTIVPSVQGQVDSFSVSLPLPLGLDLDPKTGVIAGLAAQQTEARTYEITARNSSGETKISLTFSVQLLPPTSVSYPSVDELYYCGEDVLLEPAVEGGATSWSVEPAFPNGMTLDADTGKISGAPKQTAEETSYVVTASNDAGGTSTVVTFKVAEPAPAGLRYPSALADYVAGSTVMVEPTLDAGSGHFEVESELPPGMSLDAKTGVISGEAKEPRDTSSYKVTVRNGVGCVSVDLTFSITEAAPLAPASQYATLLERVTDLVELQHLDPSKKKASGDWMLWMVHRAWLNDPELTIFDFNHIRMPLPHEEPRIAPKLMKALLNNTNITQLHLTNSNLQKPQGHQLAEVLRVNTTLQVLGMEANNLDSSSIFEMAESIKANPDSNVQQWRFNCQGAVGNNFGRPVEQALGELVEINQKILKLGVSVVDPHWRRVIDTAMIRNNDIFRRQRKQDAEAQTGVKKAPELVKPKDLALSKLQLVDVPEQPVYEVFEDDNAKFKVVRTFVAANRRLPTKEQLQILAKTSGLPLKFSEVAPLIADFRAKLLDAFVEKKVIATSGNSEVFNGTLSAWTIKNEKWFLDVWPAKDKRYHFRGDGIVKPPVLEVSEAVAQWLRVDVDFAPPPRPHGASVSSPPPPRSSVAAARP